MIIFIKNTSWCVFAVFQHLSPSISICLNICSFLRVYIQPAHVCISSGSKWERNREMEGDGVQERKMERERWPLVLSKREMSRCGKATERKTEITAAFNEDLELQTEEYGAAICSRLLLCARSVLQSLYEEPPSLHKRKVDYDSYPLHR